MGSSHRAENTSLIGRTKELEELMSHLERAGTGDCKFVFLTGPAGIGKTHLAMEVVDQARERGWKALCGKCVHEGLVPFMIVSEALRYGGLEKLMEFGDPPKIEIALLVASDGRVFTRAEREATGLDADIFASMLGAVGSFVKDSLSAMSGDTSGEAALGGMDYGRYRILIEHRPFGSLVLVLTGQETELLKDDMVDTMDRISRLHGKSTEDWDGDKDTFGPLLHPEVERFISSGQYDGIDEVVDPENRHWRLLTNITRGLTRASKDAPIMLFLDALQWVDPSSLGLLRHLLKRMRGERLMVIGCYRDQEVGRDHPLLKIKEELQAEGLLEEVPIGPLETEDLNSLVAEEIGGELASSPLGHMVAEKGAGNPFMVKEIVTYLRSEGILVLKEGHYQLTKPIDHVGVPGKVRDAVIARLGRLSREGREVLEAGAVLGEVFRPAPLACLLEMRPLAVHRTLMDVARGSSLVQAIEEGKRYRFDHPLVRETLYEAIPKEMVKEYHKEVVDCLMKDEGEDQRAMERLAELAHHAEIGQHPKAVTLLGEAGDKAKMEFQNAEAIKFYTKAIDTAPREDRCSLMRRLGETEVVHGRFEKAIEWFKKARELEGEKDGKVLLTCKIARAHERIGQFKEALQALEEVVPEDDDSLVTAKWRSTKAFLCYRLVEYDDSISNAKDALGIFEQVTGMVHDWKKAGPPGHDAVELASDIADCFNTLGSVNVCFGTWDDAKANYVKGQQLAEVNGALYQSMRICTNLSGLDAILGDFEAALEYSLQALNYAQRTGSRLIHGVSLLRAGIALRFLTRYEEAMDHLGQSYDILSDIGVVPFMGEVLRFQAACLLEQGRVKEAERKAREAFRLVGDKSEFGICAMLHLSEVLIEKEEYEEATELLEKIRKGSEKFGIQSRLDWSLRNMALIQMRQGNYSEAEAAFSKALGGQKGIMERWLYGVGLRWWGECLAAMGEKERAKEKLDKAHAIFSETGSKGEVQRIENDLDGLS